MNGSQKIMVSEDVLEERKKKAKERKRLWYLENIEERKAVFKRYYHANKEYFADRHAVYHAENRERLIAYASKRGRENPESVALAGQKLRAKRIKRVPAWYSELDDFIISEAILLCKARRDSTGLEWHVDHMLPMNGKTVSGLHVWQNVQCIPAYLNHYKKNKVIMTEPFEWIEHLNIANKALT